jgi:alpha-1,3-rhamnosyltransferase
MDNIPQLEQPDSLIQKLTILQGTPLVSIVVITYNSAMYVVETLESSNDQTYQNIELIVSDDCSTDNTVDTCRHWIENNKSRFVRTQLITSPSNTGIPANCNRGLSASQGEWMKLIAGDDAMMPDCIEVNIDHVLKRTDIRVLLSDVTTYLNSFDEKNIVPRDHQPIPRDFFNANITAMEQYKLLLKSDYVGTTPTIFIKTETIKHVDGFDERYKLVEDYPVWLKLTSAGYKLNFLDKVTVKYRKTSTAVHNMTQEYFIKPAFFRNEMMRREYIYPNLPLHEYIYQKYFYNCALIFKFLTGNKPSKIGYKLFAVSTFSFNPIKYLRKKNQKCKMTRN